MRLTTVNSLLLALAFVSLVGCNRPTPLPTIAVDGDRAFKRVQEIVDLGPKPSNSANAKKTADYLKTACSEWCDEVVLDTWTEETATGEMTFHNVYATFPGKGKTVVLGTHFDTKDVPNIPSFCGANDGGSSTGLALEILATLSALDAWHGPTVIVAFFDGEECVKSYTDDDGLHGSKRMVKWLEQEKRLGSIDAMVLMDMIGDKDLKLTISPDDDATLRRLLNETAAELRYGKHLGSHRGSITDDHVPFKEKGIPAIDLIDFNYGPGNGYWHTDEDTMDKLSANSLKVVGELTIRLLQKIYWQP